MTQENGFCSQSEKGMELSLLMMVLDPNNELAVKNWEQTKDGKKQE